MTSPSMARVLTVLLGLLFSAGAVQADDSATGNEPYPLEYWALREVVSNAAVSPDGEHIGMLKILSKDGDPILHIYDSDNLDDPDPILVNSDPMYCPGDLPVSARTLRNRLEMLIPIA